MNITINPFQQLYFSDDTQNENNFVELFSEQVLQTAIHPVFQGGNVVLSGTQGCGKTMILSLLRPETRIAYWKLKREFPVNPNMRNFISAGVNLTRSRITDLVQVSLQRGDDADERELPLYFSDFFNYLLVDDLIKSAETIGNNPEVFDCLVNLANIEKFVFTLANQDCWFGYLDGVQTLEELKDRITTRINFYRRWVNGNFFNTEPPIEIRQSKTNIGEPIARTAECFRQSGMIAEDVPVLIRIDQIEELHRAFTDRQRILLLAFRKMINRVFASRDARVHYRAGTRRYGWNNPEFLGIWGSEARLENRRDYNLIDMDQELFARGEIKNSIYQKFTIDAFQKRVKYYFPDESANLKLQNAKSIFGKSPKAEERIRQLKTQHDDSQIDRALGLDLVADSGQWSEEWRLFLRNLFRTGYGGMLDAVLAAAWGRQTGGGRSKVQHREFSPPTNLPWRERKWWRKERLDQAVLQLMIRCQQRFVWWGYDDICSLSGGNITVFFHICHRIWDGFLKNEASLPENRRTDILNGGVIPPNIQDAGILFASNEWFNKLPEEPGGNARKNFVEKLGMKLNNEMLGDLRMAYPGGNGISFVLSEFESEADDIADLRSFIREAVGYGALVEFEHSSKLKKGGRRIKFYLNPILCPRFQLPEARTKEPYYWKIQDLFDLAGKAQVTLPKARKFQQNTSSNQFSIPGFEE
ncbi:MAG: ORC-CDC6 family AAA ATPase [Pseudobdellovibrionaceae bacterium]